MRSTNPYLCSVNPIQMVSTSGSHTSYRCVTLTVGGPYGMIGEILG